ncbi:M20 family metallo-hydrolase [Virgibacillus sp. MSJ-26]|uniref:M20 family metallo-hydrolase n=1 Tax=Virgibacillus sp. MSJ-26 TaxID=2841522 RepID=UPI001C11E6ED|nr:M20 family metallo-hydrolase [Virgibacillus sp. MSJ-26]MBU5465936.1 M20 family metallo-hydrolase [Virgibacillus sp. MSJ-26]
MGYFQDEDNFYENLIKDYDSKLDTDGLSGQRLARRLAVLSHIGETENGGVNRPGFSQEEKQAKEFVMDWMNEAGLEVSVDGAGNVFGRLDGLKNVSPIISGSHLDSVPDGGSFDGPLGVLAALEVVEAWKTKGYTPEKPFEIAIFSDEEGARFKSGLMGSRAFMGQVKEEELTDYVDEQGHTFTEVIEEYGSDMEQYLDYEFKRKAIDMFIELHIEQGEVLEEENQPVGIVTGIAGPAWLEVNFKGEAGHAGNTPMVGRKDSLVAAAMLVKKIEELPKKVSDTAVATVGKLNVIPNGSNVIPGEVNLIVDVRDIHEETRDELLGIIEQEAKIIAETKELDVDMIHNSTIKPLPIEKKFQQELAEILKKHQIKPVYIPSGAGHDSMILGTKVPVAMLFVRSKDGISHHPDEWSSLSDCIQGVHVLKDYIEKQMETKE